MTSHAISIARQNDMKYFSFEIKSNAENYCCKQNND